MADGNLPCKAALFVDFDNIFRGLEETDSQAARRFAQAPDQWLNWFKDGEHESSLVPGQNAPDRAILLRRCYLSPHTFGNYRSFFTRAGFTVVDCPALTGRGKNSADIVMVMDILDALEHKTRFDEFIILSGDADFTPVLLRLRAHDRRTAVVTNVFTAAAYKAACDISVDQETFMEDALGIADREPAAPIQLSQPTAATTPPVDLVAIAESVVQYVNRNGRVVPADLIAVFKRYDSFANGNWFGFGTLRKLCEAIAHVRSEIVIEGSDPTAWTVGLATDALAISTASGTAPTSVQSSTRKEAVLQYVEEELASSPSPIDMAALGKQIIRKFGPEVKQSEWEGAGTLTNLLRSRNNGHIAVHITPAGSGFAYDPKRHSAGELETLNSGHQPHAGSAPRFQDLPQPLAELIEKVTHVTGCPRLTPEEYQVIFNVIADYPFEQLDNPNQLSAAIRDICRDRGTPIGRANISFVLTAFRFRHYDLQSSDKNPATLAQVFKENVIDLCENASLPLSDDDKALLDAWLVGDQPSPEAQELPPDGQEPNAGDKPPFASQDLPRDDQEPNAPTV